MQLSDLHQTTTDLVGPRLQVLRRLAWGMIVVGFVLVIASMALLPDGVRSVLPSYLYAYLFWTGVTVGSLALLLLHHVVGGGWSFMLRRLLEAGTQVLPVMLLLFFPIAAGLFLGLYEWNTPEGRADPALQAKAAWLNPWGFLGRTFLYFIIWMVFARLMLRWGGIQDRREDPRANENLNRIGGFGMVVYALTITAAGVDWVMSLTPHWYSSIYGLLTIASQALSTLALMLVLLAYLAGDTPFFRALPTKYFRDLGNLLLAVVLLWSYLSFSQYLIIYSGNLREEIPFYLDRARGHWGWISLSLLPLHFFLPFFILMVGYPLKDNPRRLGMIAFGIVVARFLDLFWWVVPTFRDHLSFTGADLGAPILLGGIWLLFWSSHIPGRPVVPLHDPRVEAHLEDLLSHG